MTAVLAFLGALVAIVVVAIVVNRIRGARAHYLGAWTPEPGERVLLEDPGADFYSIGRLGQARVMSFARRRRSHAVLTSRRIVVATRVLFGRRHMITYVIHLDGDEDTAAELRQLTGGLHTTGYIVLAAPRTGLTVEDDGGKSYLRIVPEQTASGAMIEHCRLYSDMAAEFRDQASG